ncbi:MAG: hypothetical protein IT439_09465 [Phycisphaerales bacterium]|nr:hypothetical protein [Phycisphaerales bacterium]
MSTEPTSGTTCSAARRAGRVWGGLALALASGLAFAQGTMHAPVISLDWPGGTVGEYVEALRGASRDAVVNVVLDPGVSAWEVSPLKLTGVTALQALRAGASAAHGQAGARVVVDDQSTREGEAGAGFAVFSAVPAGRNDRPTNLGVLPLRSLVESLPGAGSEAGPTVDAVLSAVEAGLQLADSDGNPAILQFHQASYLLMVQGDGPEIEAASRIVTLLARDAAERRERLRVEGAAALDERVRAIAEATAGDADAAVVELNAERRRLALMHERAELEVAAREADVAQRREMHERGMTSDAELREAELVLNRAQLEAEMVGSEIQRVEDRLVLAQSRAGGGSIESLDAAAAGLRERIDAARNDEAAIRERLSEAAAREGVDVSPAELDRLKSELARAERERADLESRLATISARREQGEQEKQQADDRASAAARDAEMARREAVEARTRFELLQRALEDEREARHEAETQANRLTLELTQVRAQLEMLRAERAKKEG